MKPSTVRRRVLEKLKQDMAFTALEYRGRKAQYFVEKYPEQEGAIVEWVYENYPELKPAEAMR